MMPFTLKNLPAPRLHVQHPRCLAELPLPGLERTVVPGRTIIDLAAGAIMVQNRCNQQTAMKFLPLPPTHGTSNSVTSPRP